MYNGLIRTKKGKAMTITVSNADNHLLQMIELLANATKTPYTVTTVSSSNSAYADEVKRRLDEALSGEIPLMSFDEVFNKIAIKHGF